MNKKELTTAVILILLIPTWLMIDSVFIRPMFPAPPEPTPTAVPAVPPVESGVEGAATETPGVVDNPAVVPEIGVPKPEEVVPELPVVEQTLYSLDTTTAEGEKGLSVVFSNIGAGIQEVVLHEYPKRLEDKENPEGERVRLDFSGKPALVYDSAQLNEGTPFSRVETSNEGTQIVFEQTLANGVVFTRTVSVRDTYVLGIVDQWSNATDTAVLVPEASLYLGEMIPQENINQKFGPYVGIDAGHTQGVGAKHYVKKITKDLKDSNPLEETIETGLTWFAVKNKFFSQVLTFEPGELPGAEALTLRASKGEMGAVIGSARPSARLDSISLEPGKVIERSYSYYTGPTKMANLKALGGGQEAVVDFRLWKVFQPIAKLMLQGLNGLYSVTGNWGVAIILLTFVVRMLFWPLTQKGAENMKRMSALSPQMKELREKYKSNPQRLNQEMAAFYKEHKVNPMAGCLPMLVQVPVFISLYGILRVAVGLRFADFLWISDLSEQEAIFFLGTFPVNILPLTVCASMVFQQRLTPSNMDPQQQKIMMMMPVVFLFISYSMPSGLLLYWTTSNLVSIYQTTHTKKRDAKREANQGASVSDAKPASKTVDKTKTSAQRKGKK
jgi:YidC/Oxa1 family membrane protein insertase